jgi:glycogen operon protein
VTPPYRLSPGSPEPLGVTLDDAGANVAVFSAHAAAIEFCLFDPSGSAEIARIDLPERSGNVFHGHVAGIGLGARYGLMAPMSLGPGTGSIRPNC